MNEKPVKMWRMFLIIPIPLIIAAVLLQAFVLFSSPGSDPTFFFGALSVVSMLAGIVGIVLLLGFPVWIIMLVNASKHNKLRGQGSIEDPQGTQ